MTYEQLIKAQNSLKEIDKIKKCIEVLENGYVNNITGWDYSSNKTEGERVSFTLDGELRKIVTEYLKSQLKELEIEFEKI